MYSGEIPLDAVPHFDVTTHIAATGAVSDADSPPEFDVFEEATDTPILSAVAMTKRTSKTGDYRGTYACSIANGFEVGKWYNVVVTAIVSSITAKLTVMTFRLVPAESAAGVPKVDPSHWLGTALGSPDTAGYPKVTVKDGTGQGEILTTSGKVDGVILADACTLTTTTTTAVNLTNAPTNGDLTATMKSSVTTAATAATPIAASVSGNVVGSVGSVASGGITAASFAASAIDATAIANGAIDAATFAAGAINAAVIADGAIDAATFAADALSATAVSAAAVTKIQAGLAITGAAMTLTSGERNAVAAALLDLANGIETDFTLREALRILLSADGGKLSGVGTATITVRDVNDTTDRIVATVDATGRLAMVLDAS